MIVNGIKLRRLKQHSLVSGVGFAPFANVLRTCKRSAVLAKKLALQLSYPLKTVIVHGCTEKALKAEHNCFFMPHLAVGALHSVRAYPTIET
eukprot:5098309-Amphidinium_carterae.1